MPSEFGKQYRMASGREVDASVTSALKRHFPEALAVRRADPENDKIGVDYWIECTGRFIAVDVKVRTKDYGGNKPEIALETWSNWEARKPGWSRDLGKITDYVMWFWLDTKRTALFDYRMLRSLTMRHWEQWESQYQTATQITQTASGTYSSRCVFISSADLHAELFRFFAQPPVAVSTSHRSVGDVGT
jgi:hypothetical protein